MTELMKAGEAIYSETMTSLQIAEITGKEHKSVLRDIRNLLNNISEIGGYSFVPTEYKDSQGKNQPSFTLTKKDCLLLASGYDAKLRAMIINRWEELEISLEQKKSAVNQWNNARALGIPYRKIFTDAIQVLVSYAYENGSKNASKYYMIYTNMFNSVVGCESRETATTAQLGSLLYFENVTANVILLNISQGVHYKEIYRKCKDLCTQMKVIANAATLIQNKESK